MTDLSLLHLLQLSDPTLPIGSFAHSSGLETYVQHGHVYNTSTAQEFIEGQLRYNIALTDAALASLAFDAALQNDFDVIKALDAECTAVKLPREMRESSNKLGLRLSKIFEPLAASVCSISYLENIKAKKSKGHYCIFFGIYSAAMKLDKLNALNAFFYNAAAGMVTNCVKLIPLGQQDGQVLLFGLHPLITELGQKAVNPNRETIGMCCAAFDIRSMQHEQLYSRLYMS
jgi:urease accessory protein